MSKDFKNKIVSKKEAAQGFWRSRARIKPWRTFGMALLGLTISPVALIIDRLSRPLRKIDYQAYTTKEKLAWHMAKKNKITKSDYHKLGTYTKANDFQKGIAKVFNSYASYQATEEALEICLDYSKDPNIVPVPKPGKRNGLSGN